MAKITLHGMFARVMGKFNKSETLYFKRCPCGKDLTVDTEWHTPTHADVSDPGAGHNTCERGHLHLVGWILKDWADEHPTATHSEIVGAGATNFYGANVAIDLSSASVNGKTYYAVWAKVVTP